MATLVCGAVAIAAIAELLPLGVRPLWVGFSAPILGAGACGSAIRRKKESARPDGSDQSRRPVR